MPNPESIYAQSPFQQVKPLILAIELQALF